MENPLTESSLSAPTQEVITPEQNAQYFSAKQQFLDLAYAPLSPAQKLDLYIPEGTSLFPLVIIIHSGGFSEGDKANTAEMERVEQLLSRGYAAASINYRLSGEAIYPAQIHDAKAAVRFLRARAEDFNLNPQKFGTWGSSAGGTLAALLGTTCSVPELEGAELGNADQSSCVQAVVDWFGLVDLLKMEEQFAGTDCPANFNNVDSAESRLVGAPIQTVPDLVRMTNPANFIDPADAPFFIQHGSADCRVPPQQSRDLALALAASLGAECVIYEPLEGASHGGAAYKTDANLKKVFDFLDHYLK